MTSRDPSRQETAAHTGVAIMTGDPKNAILKLSGPMIVAMLLMSLYHLINSVWVAGLGDDALAAVGFVTPLFMILIGIGNGLGAGATSVIARCIGSRNKARADNAAMHAMVLTGVISIVLTILLVFFLEPLLLVIGAGETTGLAVDYGEALFAGTVLMLFNSVAYGLLRAEGDVKRTMYAMSASAVLNAILDPILIYTFGLGIAGAGWATVISMATVTAIMLYWFLVKRDTYLTLSWKNFTHEWRVHAAILQVGLPASLEMLLISSVTIIINGILVAVSGTDAVAVYSAGWRIVMIATVPIIAVGAAVVTVAGAAFGAKQPENVAITHTYATKVGVGVAIATGILSGILAPVIAALFSYSPDSAHLAPAITAFLQSMCLFYIFMAPGVMSSSIFQAAGDGVTALILAVLREVVFIGLFAYLLAIPFGFGEYGVWWGIVAGQTAGGIVAHVWARLFIKRLKSNVSLGQPAPVA
ncbi:MULTISPECIES: MATE family efflux transporter [unclassified Methanoculleus]|jgi:putative MATE family efflux protein|uniref:MATE family efflux transporter n=1 Tax=Methanoculleus palmolei TaxID=72612 RepID=A0ABD8A961_9EURY|nr:MATE family efflux transporter [Methanoculleus sp. UBA377]WOX55151.1 MATE family efflux transporter [Methanoculleus palmolei]